MITTCTMPIIRRLPADAFIEPEHAVMTDHGNLIITAIRGTIIDWHVLASVDPESDDVIAMALHALDHGQPNEPYRTNTTIDGAAYIYDPEAKQGFTARDPLAYEAAVQVFPSSTADKAAA